MTDVVASTLYPTPLSPATEEVLNFLVAASAGLLRDWETRRSASTTGRRSNVADNIRRYLAMLTAGCLSANDAQMALGAANLLTTVNKGVGDAEISGEERAFAVTKNAIQAARQLREDAGMAF